MTKDNLNSAQSAVNWFEELGLADFVAVDLETTGLDPQSDQIIEIGAVRFVHGKASDKFQTFLSCPKPLDSFITELTGITDSDLQNSPSFLEVTGEFSSFLAESVIVGQNVDFDLQFLSASGRRIADTSRENLFTFRGRHVIDTAMLARIFWPEFTRFSLNRLCHEFGVTLEQAHRAVADARATGEVLAIMINKLPQRVWGSLADSLNHLIQTTTHRSRFFFNRLSVLAKDIPKPVAESNPSLHTDASPVEMPGLVAWFEEKGVFEQNLERFSHRPIQQEMAELVDAALQDNRFSLIEAPTGTGKSLAYLLPALLWTEDERQEERQVVISSHTKALQEQLFSKDVQDIALSLKHRISAAVLKGRRNYLCKRRLNLLLRDADQRLSESECLRLLPLLRWAELTQTGDIAEIGGFNEQADPYLWSQVCSDSQACAGSSCSSGKGDFHRAAQEIAAKSKLVFVNHALLMSDTDRFLLKPAPLRKVIIDEAHSIERAVVAAMTVELTAAQFRDALTRIADERSSRGILYRTIRANDSLGDELVRRVQSAIDKTALLFGVIRTVFAQLPGVLLGMAADPNRSLRIRFRKDDNLHRTVNRELDDLLLQWREFSIFFEALVSDLLKLRGEEKLPAELLFELRSSAEQINSLLENLALIVEAADRNRVFWVEAGSGRLNPWCALYAAPITISEMMHKEFWQKVDSAVLTSATLTCNGGFRHIREALGLDLVESSRVAETALNSPFNLPEQMQVLAPLYMPDPRQQQAHNEAVAELASDLAGQVFRGTLILCTSLEAVRQIGNALEPVARKAGRILLTQRSSGAPYELLKQFRRHNDAILIGAASFWEGIDVIGDSLQILIIAKLPFDVPTEPWVEARSEHLRDAGRDAFNEFSIPSATLKLKQGLGRLIRHQNDIGVAILCDPRLMQS
ncbi:DEAD/DEAH box helicase, partial [bacterium]|nr:DEAD/DEAH box helicase [bacterium]